MLKRLFEGVRRRLDLSGRDFAVMLLSLLLAFGIWFTHNLSLQYSSLVSVPVTAVSNIPGHARESSNTVVVVARCRTTGYNLLSKGRNRTVEVLFSADDLHQDDEELFHIGANELGGYVREIFGDNVQLESFVTADAQFRFPVEYNKVVPVLAISSVSYKPQYTALEPMRVVPDSVVVYGEPARLQSIERILTETISEQNLSSSAHGVARLEIPKGVSRVSDTQVSYSLTVTRFVDVTSQVNVKVRGVPAGKEVSVYPSVAQVVYRCVFPLPSDPTRDVSFYVDYADFASSKSGRCVPHVTGLPSYVLEYTTDPQVFECIENVGK